MATEAITGRVLRWGNSYGIRLSKADVDRLGLQPGAEARVIIDDVPRRADLSSLPTFRGGGNVSQRHDEYLGAARSAELERRRVPHRRRPADEVDP